MARGRTESPKWAPRLAWTALAVAGAGAAWFGFMLFGMTVSHSGLATRQDWMVNTSIFVGTVLIFAFTAGRALRAWRRR